MTGPMPLETFLSEAKTYCQTLESKDAALFNAYRIFDHSMDISSEQYRQINSLMQQVGETMEELCLLLSDTESLPQSARSYRYLPLVAFQYMDGQVQAILSALASMHQLHKTSSLQKDRLKLMIHNKLKSLRQDLHKGLGHIQALRDQALLEEKRMNHPPSRKQQNPYAISDISYISRARDKQRPRSSPDQAGRSSWDVQID